MKTKTNKWYLLLLPILCFNTNVALANMLSCFGGQVSLAGGISSLVQCTQNDNPTLHPQNNSTSTEAEYFYVLTNNNALIITHFSTADGIDMDAYGVGTYRIYGFSYTGVLNENTLQTNLPYMGISSNDCFSYTTNFITITRNSCEAINCQGGNIFTSQGDTYISVCADGVPDVFTFTTTSTGNALYTFVVADNAGNIIDITTDNTFNFEGFPVGHYSVRGISYHGEFIEASIQPGQPVSNIASNGSCLDFSTYSIGVDVAECIMGEGCTRLYISEYIEGTQNNRAIEIYNPTAFPVNLSNYAVFVYANGSTEELPVIALSGVLQPGDVYVITNSQAATELLSASDITGGVATFTGNDAVVLLYNLQPIDIIGVVGEDPGINGWTWQNGNEISSTTNRTLVRKSQVNAPTTNWILSRGQWHVYPENDFTHIGTHNAETCDHNVYIGFENSAIMVAENIGTFEIGVNGFNIQNAVDITVSVTGGTATSGLDYVNSFPIVLNFSPANTVHNITLEIIDDDIMEEYEYFTLQLSDATNTVTFVNQTLNITIEYSDQQYPDRTIAEITTINSFGVADSADVFCTIGGVVHGNNLNAAGIEFTLIENNAGIKIFDPEENHGYSVNESDSVRVSGRVAQFFGMIYFYADAIAYINNGHELNAPQLITQIGEQHESAMIKIDCVKLVNPSQWTNLTSGFDVDVTDGNNSFVMHIDLDMDIYGTPAPQGHFSVTGIGAQHDETAPFNSGYTIWPRYLEDIGSSLIASFTPGSEIVFGDGGSTVAFQNTSNGGTSFLWSFGDGQTSTEENPVHVYPYSFFIGMADVVISLTITDEFGCSDTHTRNLDLVYSSINEVNAAQFSCYPNPVNDKLVIECDEKIQSIRVFDSVGMLIYSTESLNANQEILQTNNWAAGLYFVEVRNQSTMATKKVVKH